ENGNATSWEVIYGESGFDPVTEGENILVENNPELNLTDLSPNTTYEFYIEALCSDNETELSESENFTTLELPCNPPSNLNVTNITESSASVSWTENGNATSWEVIYGESGFDPVTEGENILVENDPQISLTDLSSNTTYEFYVKGLCSENESDLVGPETFTTLPLCNPPSN
ncbi:fibronectin type III domain-containing protein, partial [Mesonia oceanica]|uniref:fibronectin type III domain-containing protein n=1 Tax=Mesonia oceanica TaxID=2687242 RepID=UPI00123FE8AF